MGMIVFHSWWALALRGVLAILFGLVALFWPHPTLKVLVICFGAFALPGVGLLALIWLMGAYAIVFGVLLLLPGFQWRKVWGHDNASNLI